MNDEQKVFAKKIREMLTEMYNRGFADCEASAKLAIEVGIKKAMFSEREACAKLCDNWLVGRDDICEVAKAIRARNDK